MDVSRSTMTAEDRLRTVRRSRSLLVERLAVTLDYRERGISNRARRLSRYTWLLARAAGARQEMCERIALAAPLHDIGMVGVSEAILHKPGPLEEWEWKEVRVHPELGAELVGEHQDLLLGLVRTIALSHHERWDGDGYPYQLAGEAIPVAGRLMAVIDAFDAMTVTQRHSPPISGIEAARKIIAETGKQFDPAMVVAFRKALPKLGAVLNAFPDRLEGFHDLDFSAPDGLPKRVNRSANAK